MRCFNVLGHETRAEYLHAYREWLCESIVEMEQRKAALDSDLEALWDRLQAHDATLNAGGSR